MTPLSLLTTAVLPALAASALVLDPHAPLSSSEAPRIPPLGFGTWKLKVDPSNATAAVALAVEAGYRHVDCAAAHGNQEAVGEGIAQGLATVGLQTKDLCVTSKLWNDQGGFRPAGWMGRHALRGIGRCARGLRTVRCALLYRIRDVSAVRKDCEGDVM